jgi:predicted transcriptional regulator
MAQSPLKGGVPVARARKATQLQALELRARVLTAFLAAVKRKDPLGQRAVARELGISETRVSRLLDRAFAEWRQLCADRVDQIVEESRRDFAWVRAEAAEQWERSKQNAETTITEQQAGGDGGGPRAKVQKTVKARTGDPRYLQVILDARDKLIKLTVGYKPQKLEVTVDPRQELAELLGVSVDELPPPDPTL